MCVCPLDPSAGGPSVGMCLTCECCVGVSGCHMYSVLVCVCLIIRCSVGVCVCPMDQKLVCMSTLWYYVGVCFCYVYLVLVCVYAIWIQCWCMYLPYVSSVAVDVCIVDPVLVCVLYGSCVSVVVFLVELVFWALWYQCWCVRLLCRSSVGCVYTL